MRNYNKKKESKDNNIKSKSDKLSLCFLYLWTELSFIQYYYKRYFKMDQHLARHFVYYGGCLSNPPPFLCSQIMIPFLNSMISTNHEKGKIFSQLWNPLTRYSSSSLESLLLLLIFNRMSLYQWYLMISSDSNV